MKFFVEAVLIGESLVSPDLFEALEGLQGLYHCDSRGAALALVNRIRTDFVEECPEIVGADRVKFIPYFAEEP